VREKAIKARSDKEQRKNARETPKTLKEGKQREERKCKLYILN